MSIKSYRAIMLSCGFSSNAILEKGKELDMRFVLAILAVVLWCATAVAAPGSAEAARRLKAYNVINASGPLRSDEEASGSFFTRDPWLPRNTWEVWLVLGGIGLVVVGGVGVRKRGHFEASMGSLAIGLAILFVTLGPTKLGFHLAPWPPNEAWVLAFLWFAAKATEPRIDDITFKGLVVGALVLSLAIRGTFGTVSFAVPFWWVLALIWIFAFAESMHEEPALRVRPALQKFMLIAGFYVLHLFSPTFSR